MRFERVSREAVYEGRILHVFRDRVRVEPDDGSPPRVLELEHIEHPGAACVVPFLDDGRVVLLRQFRYSAGGELWELPAGKLDGGERPDACARRELEEETGWVPGRLIHLATLIMTPGFCDERIAVFAALELRRGRGRVSAGSAAGGGCASAAGGRAAPADVWVALCTAPDAETAARLGRSAVEGGHAACANLLPGVRSLFRWEGELREEGETLIVFKTTAGGWRGLAELVTREHPYEVPELIAFPLAAGLEGYLRWVRESIRPASSAAGKHGSAGARVDSPTGST